MRLKRVNSNEAAPSSSIVPPAYVDPKTGARQRPDSQRSATARSASSSPSIGWFRPGFDLAMDLLVEVGHCAGGSPGWCPTARR